MAGLKAFIGYDLGDGETITDMVVLDIDTQKQLVRTDFSDMPMPDSTTPGRALPTIFARDEGGRILFSNSILTDSDSVRDIHINFKRKPTDLLGELTDEHRRSLLALFESTGNWPDPSLCPECSSEKMDEFRNSVVTFTDAIFTDGQYVERIMSFASNCQEIVFCVGHPTKWDELDVAVYKAILGSSILGRGEYHGKPSSLVMAAESRAAFLYAKNQGKSDELKKGKSALLVDVGSSTIDLTAMTADSRNHQYNSGNNYLGARSIDHMIRDWYLEQLMADKENQVVYQELMAANPSLNQTLTLFCREAKEKVYSFKTGKANIFFGYFRPVQLSREKLDHMLRTVPIADILKRDLDLPQETAEQMGSKSWCDLFRAFMQEQKAQMEQEGISIGRVILTGSASKMPVVPEIVKEVFSDIPESALFFDMDPSRTISKGLALVGPSNDKSVSFQMDVSKVLREDVPRVVKNNVANLAASLSNFLSGKMESMMISHIKAWRNGDFATFNDMNKAIMEDCSAWKIQMDYGEEYSGIVRKWCTDVIGKDIAVSLKGICEKNGVSNFSVEDLNIAGTGNALIGKMADIVMSPATKTKMNRVISQICNRIIVILIVALCWVPILSWAVLFGGAGVMIWNAFTNNEEGSENKLVEFVKDRNIAVWMRKLVGEANLESKVKEAKISESIREAFMENENQEKIVADIVESLNAQVQSKMDDIKYVIESR